MQPSMKGSLVVLVTSCKPTAEKVSGENSANSRFAQFSFINSAERKNKLGQAKEGNVFEKADQSYTNIRLIQIS